MSLDESTDVLDGSPLLEKTRVERKEENGFKGLSCTTSNIQTQDDPPNTMIPLASASLSL